MVAAVLLALCSRADPAVAVTWADGDGPRTVVGRVIAEGGDGGVLLEGRDGALHAVAAARLTDRAPTGAAFAPLSGGELAAALAADLGAGAAPRVTPHFAVASTASAEFTAWACDLLEAVFAGFAAEFAPPGGALPEPPGPLPVLILKDRAAFEAFAARPDQAARGVNPALSQGYYDPVSNRVVLYDFSGAGGGAVRQRIAHRQANVATVAHEATHQLAYNAGLHARLADNPVWLTEGLAMQAEAADPRSPLGWRGFGTGANPGRSKQWRIALAARRRDPTVRDVNPLPGLIETDDAFADPAVAASAYAAAWVLVKHLRQDRPEAFATYLADLAALPPLAPVSPERRGAMFRERFGEDLDGLWRAIQRVR